METPVHGRTMYNRKHYRMGEPLAKVVLVAIFVLLFLGGVRFLNLVMWWNMTRLEVSSSSLTQVDNYQFIGYSDLKAAREKMDKFERLNPKAMTIVSYFDIWHPAVFLIRNNGGAGFVHLGNMVFYPLPGFSALLIRPSEVIEMHRPKSPIQAVYFGESLFPGIYERYASTIAGGVGESGKGAGMSFVVKPMKDSRYMKIPYYVYFYLPLLLILVLGNTYGNVFYISFFYYVELFLLYDFRRVLFTIPFSWLLNLMDLKPSQTVTTIIAIVIAFVFLVMSFIGLFSIRKKELHEKVINIWGKAFIFIFLMLPIVLRF